MSIKPILHWLTKVYSLKLKVMQFSKNTTKSAYFHLLDIAAYKRFRKSSAEICVIKRSKTKPSKLRTVTRLLACYSQKLVNRNHLDSKCAFPVLLFNSSFAGEFFSISRKVL